MAISAMMLLGLQLAAMAPWGALAVSSSSTRAPAAVPDQQLSAGPNAFPVDVQLYAEALCPYCR